MAETEGVDDSDIIMFINDRTIHPYDSPKSLGITVADIIGLFNNFHDYTNYVNRFV